MSVTRTFIAAPVTDQTRRSLGDFIKVLRKRMEGVQWTAPENLHITLAFLGDMETHRLGEVCSAVDQACAEQAPFTLTWGGLGAFPHTRQPHILWVGITEGQDYLQHLHQQLEFTLEPIGYRAEARPYKPHLTLGRVGRNRQLVLTTPRGNDPFKTYSENEGDSWMVGEIHTMASDLSPSGPVYSVISRHPLHANLQENEISHPE